ncbi:uncharacterized protein LOC130804372 [Amaranthus tricolor]|uniref:uncharacterized protein LOC130804372 n=1 Tax=Amaranthus tricolor TaxID=29722 RepID=UPI0025910760|nr:uncharacterized protein LOC130804372 [Amaranthus tricolor]
MEAAKIDWKSIESVFVLDQVYENINAPQWVDFLASSSPSLLPREDDVAWFCRSDCKHPRCAEDFLKSSPTSKLLRSVSVSKLIGLTDWTRREATNLKRRGTTNPNESESGDSENQNPNLSTPNQNQIKYNKNKAAIKSSAQKEGVEYSDIMLESTLKPTLSAKDLFGGTGKDLFGKITDLCHELKKMASTSNSSSTSRAPTPTPTKDPHFNNSFQEKMTEKEKERKPLLEVKPPASADKTNVKSKQHNKLRGEDGENIPISLNLSNIKHNDKMSPMAIRMNPPTPQGFSATREPIKATPSKAQAQKSRLLGREVFQELEQKNKTLREELGLGEKNESGNASTLVAAAKEGRALDVFWFLKPCTLSN